MSEVKSKKREHFTENSGEWFAGKRRWTAGVLQRERYEANRPARIGFQRHGVPPTELVHCEPATKGGVTYLIKTSTPAAAAHQVALEWRQAELEERVSELSSQYLHLESAVRELSRQLESKILTDEISEVKTHAQDPAIADLVKVTETLFQSPIIIENDTDPADPGVLMTIFNVKCTGTAKELVAKELEWNRRVMKLKPGSSGHIRLIVSSNE